MFRDYQIDEALEYKLTTLIWRATTEKSEISVQKKRADKRQQHLAQAVQFAGSSEKVATRLVYASADWAEKSQTSFSGMTSQ